MDRNRNPGDDDEKYHPHSEDANRPQSKPSPPIPQRPSPNQIPSQIPTNAAVRPVSHALPPVSHVPTHPSTLPAQVQHPSHPPQSTAQRSSPQPYVPSPFEHNYSTKDMPDHEVVEVAPHQGNYPDVKKINAQNAEIVDSHPLRHHDPDSLTHSQLSHGREYSSRGPSQLPPQDSTLVAQPNTIVRGSSTTDGNNRLIIGYHPSGQPIVMIDETGKLSSASSISHSQQIYYPIFLFVLLAALLIMAFVPQWEKSDIRKYRSLQPLLLTSFGLAAVCLVFAAIHSVMLLITGQSLWHNHQKLRTPSNLLFYIFNLILISLSLIFFATCVLIMMFSFNDFHSRVSMLSAVSWWASGCLAAPIFVYLFIRSLIDLIQVARRPPAAPKVPKDPYAQQRQPATA